MTAGRVANTNGDGGHCVRCGDSGWLYLKELHVVRTQHGTEYQAPVMVPCGFCAAGHRHHDKYPHMRWGYRRDEVDLYDPTGKPSVEKMKEYTARVRAAGDVLARRYAEMDPYAGQTGPGPVE